MGIVSRYSFILVLGIVFSLMACAVVEQPSGGPKDKTAPKIDTSRSDPLLIKNFPLHGSDREIELYFDEYIQIGQIAEEVLLTPPLSSLPSISARGEKLSITFPEDTLLTNTTYLLYLGSLVSDLNEKNKLEDVKIILSTGDEIDSLSLDVQVESLGKVHDLSGTLVMLYTSDSDSVIYSKKPTYFAKTDKSGHAKLEYLKEGTYKMFALRDENLPYVYDSGDELVGFLDSMISITDTTESVATIKIFKEEKENRIVGDMKLDNGKSAILLEQATALHYSMSDTSHLLFHEQAGDSIILWHKKEFENYTNSIFLHSKGEVIDSFRHTVRKEEPHFPKPNLNRNKIDKIIPGKEYELRVNLPIASLDRDKMFMRDTSDNSEIKFDIIGGMPCRNFKLISNGKKPGILSFLPGAFQSIYETENDSMRIEVIPLTKGELSKTDLYILGMDTAQQYLLSLLDNKKIIYRNTITGLDSFHVEMGNILPKKYTLRIVSDENKNEKYDGPSLEKKLYGEEVLEVELDNMRANWDYEKEIILDGQ